MNGLVGLKPTVGLVSRSGIIPISVSQDTAGPMARTVADAALLLTRDSPASDPDDPAGRRPRRHVAADYRTFLKADALKGKRFGVLRQAMGYHPDVDASVDEGDRRDQGAGRGSDRRQGADLQRSGTIPSSTCCCTNSRMG